MGTVEVSISPYSWDLLMISKIIIRILIWSGLQG